MFKNTYQNGLLSIFYSCGSNPLALWDMEVKNGHIKRLTDNEVNSVVLEIVSTNVATTFIRCPRNDQVLGIKLPFLVMIIKNLKRYFSFEITILDDKNMRRRFRISNFQSTTKIKPFCTTMPIGLSGGWNQIQFNLSDFTRRAYGTQFLETLRVQIHANARLRRIYFSERLYTEEELPQDYKLYLPLERKQKKEKPEKKEKEVTSKVPKLRTEVPIENKVEAIQEEVPSKHSTAGTVTPAVTEVGDEQPTDAQLTDETNIVVADDNPQEAEDVLETEPPVAEE
ncbi:cilia- and flagella-associated protein 20 [Bombyx mori]|uniref:cilia- and flagella-associated protein 20 n=1 Tax=Bombyx mori TaxID=7091 RepID=UPI000B3D4C3C